MSASARRRSVALIPGARWAIDLTHVYCGRDGWSHLAEIIDCHDREVVGWEFSFCGRVRETERVPEETCLHRFGTLRLEGRTLVRRACYHALPTTFSMYHVLRWPAEALQVRQRLQLAVSSCSLSSL